MFQVALLQEQQQHQHYIINNKKKRYPRLRPHLKKTTCIEKLVILLTTVSFAVMIEEQ